MLIQNRTAAPATRSPATAREAPPKAAAAQSHQLGKITAATVTANFAAPANRPVRLGSPGSPYQPWTRPPLPGDPSRGPGADTSAGWGDRWAYTLEHSGTSGIGNFRSRPDPTAPYISGAGQEIIQIGSESTPAGIGQYIAPNASHRTLPDLGFFNQVGMLLRGIDTPQEVYQEVFRQVLDRPGATVCFTTTLDPSLKPDLLAAVQQGSALQPPVTFIIPSNVVGNDAAFLDQLKAAGAIVVGTTTPPGAAGQQPVGSPTVTVDSWEHSTADSVVASTVALLKEANPNISNQEIAQLLQAGSNPTLDVTAVLRAAGLPEDSQGTPLRPPQPGQ